MGVYKKRNKWYIDYYVDGRRKRECIVEMTLRYAHLSPDHKRATIEILCNRMDIYMDTKIKFQSGVFRSISKNYSQ